MLSYIFRRSEVDKGCKIFFYLVGNGSPPLPHDGSSAQPRLRSRGPSLCSGISHSFALRQPRRQRSSAAPECGQIRIQWSLRTLKSGPLCPTRVRGDRKPMCGIVAYVGNQDARGILIEGLKRLEYRGYDSSGIVILDGPKAPYLARAVGKVAGLEQRVWSEEPEGSVGIAHTRWATHGKPSESNSHPHRDCRRAART